MWRMLIVLNSALNNYWRQVKAKLSPKHQLYVIAVLAVLLWMPGVGGLLKQTMLSHMLVQLSLWLILGYRLGIALRVLVPRMKSVVKTHQMSLLIIAIATLLLWMVPRLLDLAVEDEWVDAAKAFSLMFLAGLPLALVWHELPLPVQCLIHVEALASLWRLAWLYIDSPARLCLQYGLKDQARLGIALVGVGAIYALWLTWLALKGINQKNDI
jgi:uncharacterized membrane protein (Fun14 family)